MLINLLKREFINTHKTCIVLRNSIQNLPQGTIYPVKRKGHTYYYHEYYTKEGRVQKYVRLKDVEALQKDISTRKELQKQLKEKAEDLQYLRRFLRIMKVDADRVLEEENDRLANREKQRRDKQQRMYSAKMDVYENRNLCTIKGDYVRSKSEMIIANLLSINGIVYEYERPLVLGQHRFHPDFTIETDHETYYWEHCGMMNDPKYQENWDYKRRVYANYGIREGKNLIITYDNEDGSIDSQELQRQIDIYFG